MSWSPIRGSNSGLSLRRRSQTRNPSAGRVCRVGERVHHQLARQLDLLAGGQPHQVGGHPAAVEPLEGAQEQLDPLDGLGGQVDRGRLHLHHPPPRHVDRQRRQVVEVGVRDEPGRRRHERPRLAAQVEAELQLGDSPVGLHGGPRIPLDRHPLVHERTDRGVVHRVVERFHRRFKIRGQRQSPWIVRRRGLSGRSARIMAV